MQNSKETRWLVVKALLDNFPDIRRRVKEHLQEEKWERQAVETLISEDTFC